MGQFVQVLTERYVRNAINWITYLSFDFESIVRSLRVCYGNYNLKLKI